MIEKLKTQYLDKYIKRMDSCLRSVCGTYDMIVVTVVVSGAKIIFLNADYLDVDEINRDVALWGIHNVLENGNANIPTERGVYKLLCEYYEGYDSFISLKVCESERVTDKVNIVSDLIKALAMHTVDNACLN